MRETARRVNSFPERRSRRVTLFGFGVDDAPKADVSGGIVRRVLRARGDAVAIAPRPVTEMRPAVHHAGVAVVGSSGIVSVVRVGRVVVGAEPVGAPLPDVTRAVVEAVAVGFLRVDRRRRQVTIVTRVALWKVALPDITAVLAGGAQLVAPGVALTFEAATGGVLPLGLGGEALPHPLGVRSGVAP